jgi:Ca-activated chloride channel family protein
LLDLYLGSCDLVEGVFVYEAVINDINARIAESRGQSGRRQCEELRAIYPADPIGFSDSPLAFIKKSDDPDDRLEVLYRQLAEYLLSAPVQKEILNLGRRPFTLGAGVTRRDLTNRHVFRADLGFDLTSEFTALVFPDASVVEKGLVLYQTRLRKPSCTSSARRFGLTANSWFRAEPFVSILLDRKRL